MNNQVSDKRKHDMSGATRCWCSPKRDTATDDSTTRTIGAAMTSVPQSLVDELLSLFDCDFNHVIEIRVGVMSATLTKLSLKDGKAFKGEDGDVAIDTITIPVDPYIESRREKAQR